MATAAYTFSMPQGAAFDYTLKALGDSGALIGTQIPPARIEFGLIRKDKAAASLDIPLTGHVLLSTLPDGQSNATLTIGPSAQYVGYAAAIGVMALLFGNLLLGGLAGLWSILVVAALAYALWLLYAKLPTDTLNAVSERMRASDKVVGGGPAAPASATEPVPPPPTPVKSQASATTDASQPIITPAPEPQKALPAPGDVAPGVG